ncbi:MAG: hypothetical protein KDD64_08195 [Bdellovibrionales bacterium]|nr:hypothetical protein [Bdellovibrionales bacterium]
MAHVATAHKVQSVREDSRPGEQSLHSTVCQAMLAARRALKEVTKVQLGQSYYFEMEIEEESHGWPVIRLTLADRRSTTLEAVELVISPRRRGKQVGIAFFLGEDLPLSFVPLNAQIWVTRLPKMLKSSISALMKSSLERISILEEAKIAVRETQSRIEEAPIGRIQDTRHEAIEENLFSEDLSTGENVLESQETQPLPLEL